MKKNLIIGLILISLILVSGISGCPKGTEPESILPQNFTIHIFARAASSGGSYAERDVYLGFEGKNITVGTSTIGPENYCNGTLILATLKWVPSDCDNPVYTDRSILEKDLLNGTISVGDRYRGLQIYPSHECGGHRFCWEIVEE